MQLEHTSAKVNVEAVIAVEGRADIRVFANFGAPLGQQAMTLLCRFRERGIVSSEPHRGSREIGL
jgi:hypothetical protein